MTKVKICGITRTEDAEIAATLGADFLGFVFVKESSRFVDPMWTAGVLAGWAGSVSLPAAAAGRRGSSRRDAGGPLFVGVFRDESVDEVRRIAEIARLDIIQLHGSEDDDYARALSLPVIKAFKVGNALPDTTSNAPWLMFDTGGGTGRCFDWSLLASYPRTKPFFLAGGLTPDNVADAIRATRPDAVDVSTGVESAPGVKDHQKLREFFERVRKT
jgi:phosphoribosylanthranilate isomerase